MRGKLVIAILVGLLASLLSPVSSARADDPSNWEWDCDLWDASTYFWTDQDGGYWYTNGRTISGPPVSYCNDINVTFSSSQPTGAFTVRVRFYLSNGTNYPNSWKTACSICWALAATNVSNGTHYRLETRNWERFDVYD